MLHNFKLAAIVKSRGQTRLLKIPMLRRLQNELSANWEQQYESFIDDVDEIEFDAGYTPEAHELFQLTNYELPDWISEEDSQTVVNLESIARHDELLKNIKGIVAFARNGDEELILFQNFSRSHIIQPGRFLLLQNNTYESTARPGITLDSKLSAVYISDEDKLLFRNFRTVNTFLPLSEYYEEASEQEIRDVLKHDLLLAENADELAINANQWLRKRFAMLRDSGILDEYTAHEILEHSIGYEVDIQLDGDQIIFPSNKAEAKRLLQFLNEEIFRGAITETLYETNSKREAD